MYKEITIIIIILLILLCRFFVIYFYYLFFLINFNNYWFMVCVHLSAYGGTQEVAKHEIRVRIA